MQGNFLLWACPECGNKHTLEIEDNLTETIHAYNQHIQAIITGLERAAESRRNKEPDPEEDAYFQRLKEAEERDQAEGGNKHVRRVKFGWWVRRLRMWHGTFIPGQKLTIAAAARGAGVSREYWTRLELGKEGYSEDVVLRVGAVVGGTVEMAYEMAGLRVPPRLVKMSSEDRMKAALEHYMSAMDVEDDAQWLPQALVARHSYWLAKLGIDKGRIVDIPARAEAISSVRQALRIIGRLPKQDERIATFKAAAATIPSPYRRLRWIKEIVQHVLTSEQQKDLAKTIEMLLAQKAGRKAKNGST